MAPEAATSLPATTARARWVGPVLAGGVVLVATGYVALVDPGQPGHYPLCPLKAVTGLDCPACGGLRAVHALSHGDLGAALDQNLAVVLLLPLTVVLWALWLRRSLRPEETDAPATPAVTPAPAAGGPAGELVWSWRRAAPYLLVVALLVFTVVRNLPFVPFLRSGLG